MASSLQSTAIDQAIADSIFCKKLSFTCSPPRSWPGNRYNIWSWRCDTRHDRRKVLFDSQHAEDERNSNRDQSDREKGSSLPQFPKQRVNRSSQHRRGEELL